MRALFALDLAVVVGDGRVGGGYQIERWKSQTMQTPFIWIIVLPSRLECHSILNINGKDNGLYLWWNYFKTDGSISFIWIIIWCYLKVFTEASISYHRPASEGWSLLPPARPMVCCVQAPVKRIYVLLTTLEYHRKLNISGKDNEMYLWWNDFKSIGSISSVIKIFRSYLKCM